MTRLTNLRRAIVGCPAAGHSYVIEGWQRDLDQEYGTELFGVGTLIRKACVCKRWFTLEIERCDHMHTSDNFALYRGLDHAGDIWVDVKFTWPDHTWLPPVVDWAEAHQRTRIVGRRLRSIPGIIAHGKEDW